jgi:hypothetical protein
MLTEIREVSQRWPSNTKKYELNEVMINADAITTLRNGSHFKKEVKMFKGWPDGLDERIVLTEVVLNANNNNVIYAVGDFENITKKIGVGNG